MLLTDLRHAIRLLARRPLFTALATLTLGIGMAANAVIFSWVDALLLNPLGDVAAQRELATLTVTTASRNGLSFSYPNYEDVRAARGGAIRDVAVFSTTAMSLRTDDGAERVWGQLYSGNMFDLLAVRPAIGRLITESDNRAKGAHRVVVISHAFWQRRFGGRSDALGQVLSLNGTPFTVIGVASPGFTGTQVALHFDVFVPVMMEPVFRSSRQSSARESPSITCVCLPFRKSCTGKYSPTPTPCAGSWLVPRIISGWSTSPQSCVPPRGVDPG